MKEEIEQLELATAVPLTLAEQSNPERVAKRRQDLERLEDLRLAAAAQAQLDAQAAQLLSQEKAEADAKASAEEMAAAAKSLDRALVAAERAWLRYQEQGPKTAAAQQRAGLQPRHGRDRLVRAVWKQAPALAHELGADRRWRTHAASLEEQL